MTENQETTNTQTKVEYTPLTECPRCGIPLQAAMGYCCPQKDCPAGMNMVSSKS